MIIVAGPPFPPWTSKGARKSWEDSRSVPFWRTLDIIVDQARSGSLLMFVLENVLGFASKQSDGTIPLILKEELPSDWTVDYCITIQRTSAARTIDHVCISLGGRL